MNKKTILVSAVTSLVVVIVGFVLFGGGETKTVVERITEKVGGSAGPFHTEEQTFASQATIGGNVFATSSQGAVTYTAGTFTANTSLIQHTATAALTATLPASSTLTAFLPRSGDTRTVYLNAITTGITLAGGTGTDLNTASSTKFIPAGQVGRLDFMRKTNTDFEVLLTPASGN